MKTVLAILTVLMFVAGFGVSEEYAVVPINVSLIPPISTGGPSAGKTIDLFQLNVVAGYADRLAGLAVGVVSIIGEDVRGVQAAVVNLTGRDLVGVQAGVLNYARNARLAQVGVVNVAGTSHGVQIGVVNVAVRNDGAPIGLLNIVLQNGMTRGQVWYDEIGVVNIAFLHGSAITYNIYTAGVDSRLENLSVGIGLGVRLPLGQLSAHVELIGGSVCRIQDLGGVNLDVQDFVDKTAGLYRARAYGAYRIGAISLIGGASLNYLAERSGADIAVSPFHRYEFGFSSTGHRFWPGLFVGVQY